MITFLLFKTLLDIFYLMTSNISIPTLPDQAKEIMADFIGYVQMGINILASYTDIYYLFILFGIVLAVDIGISVYKLVLWILKKIPLLGIE